MSQAQPKQQWTQERRDNWYKGLQVKPHRDYALTIVPRIEALKGREGIEVETYGSVTYENLNSDGVLGLRTHDLYVIRIGDFDPSKPTNVIIGGTHGYEKGGVEAALLFAVNEAIKYADTHNILIYPCLNPGPYEVEHRFAPGVIDPNRDTTLEGAKSPATQAFVRSIQEQHKRLFGDDLTAKFNGAVDLHETPLLDKTLISEMMANLQGETFNVNEVFPEGMFLIVSEERDMPLAQSIIRKVSADGHQIVEGKLYGEPNREGVLLSGEPGTSGKPGTVSDFMKQFTQGASLTTEFCGLGINDNMPDAKRAAPQLSVVRALFSEPNVAVR